MINSSAVLEINTKNFLYNYKSLAKISNKSLTGATIKANAYGLGDLEIFKILYNNGCRHFFVATIDEALKIRKNYSKGNLYVLNGINENEIKLSIEKKIIPIINSTSDLKIFNNKIQNKKNKLNIGIHVDSGINRLGIKINELKYKKFKSLEIVILLSHLASSDKKNSTYNNFQNKNFNSSFKFFNTAKYISLVNSMGILLGKQFHYDLTRPGISLYGGHYNTKLKKIIKPVIKLKARVIQIKKLEKNEFVGYNQTYKTTKPITIAILAIGYADGISRKIEQHRQSILSEK